MSINRRSHEPKNSSNNSRARRSRNTGRYEPYSRPSGRLLQSTYVAVTEREEFSIGPEPGDDSNDENSTCNIFEDYGIPNNRWTLYGVSPLYNFEYRDVKLRNYGFRLRERLRSMFVTSNQMQLQAKFEILDGLEMTSNNKPAFQVRVTCSPANDRRNKKDKYVGIFLNMGMKQHHLDNRFTHLPLLLCRGAKKSCDDVHDVISKLFDCYISPVELSQDDIIWLMTIASCLTSVADNSNLRAKFRFAIPYMPSNCKIDCTVLFTRFKTCIDRVHDPNSDKLLHEEVNKIFNAICDHFSEIYATYFELSRLTRFEIPGVVDISSNGCLKVKDSKVFHRVLLYVCEMTTLLDSVEPGLCDTRNLTVE